MGCVWVLDEVGMEKCRVPIADEFHKWRRESGPDNFEPPYPNMGVLVKEVSEQAASILGCTR